MDRRKSAPGNPDILKAVAWSLPIASLILLFFPDTADWARREFLCKIALGLFGVTMLADCLRTSRLRSKFLPTLLGLLALLLHGAFVPM